jgi:hypothetical protein
MTNEQKRAIKRFLRTREYENGFAAWPGNVIEAETAGMAAMQAALLEEVHRRTARATPPLGDPAPILEPVAFTRVRVGPMVRGLFPQGEQDEVLKAIEHSVVFLMPSTIDGVLQDARWLHTAWDLANLYLASQGCELLGPDAHTLLGLSEETTCYVSADYFRTTDRFADYVVHEVAHIFHNCKRQTVGLAETRTREWLLDIEYRKRETFAYACEAYSCLLRLASVPADRRTLLAEHAKAPRPNDERVDGDEYLDILAEAVSSRNGWKRILARCAPAKRVRGQRTAPTLALGS